MSAQMGMCQFPEILWHSWQYLRFHALGRLSLAREKTDVFFFPPGQMYANAHGAVFASDSRQARHNPHPAFSCWSRGFKFAFHRIPVNFTRCLKPGRLQIDSVCQISIPVIGGKFWEAMRMSSIPASRVLNLCWCRAMKIFPATGNISGDNA